MSFLDRYFTIGMAGHIDHGKTALTKALTGIHTDRLKEEKERNISIELGFAAFIQENGFEVSIVDVPGHENFIRQMIAGVAGIDLVIIVIAADEGIMPQTKEHIDILSLLGIKNGCIVFTKVDQADQELLDIIVDDVKENIKQTFLKDAPIYFVDSLSKKGIPELKDALRNKLLQMTKKEIKKPFRLPIDNVFTVKGQGVVVRGTIYDGKVRQGERLKLLPSYKEVRVKQIQTHHRKTTVALKGQRTAINIGGISYEDVSRGDVLVADDFYSASDRIDVVFQPLHAVKHKIKQRQPIKLHIGTAEAMGKIIFFDRNEINPNETQEVLCQIQLNEKVVMARDDRFILRRPTPVETIGGGWIIEPNAKKHRFGKKTMDGLKFKKEGSAKSRLLSLIKEKIVLTETEMLKHVSISEEELAEAKQSLFAMGDGLFTHHETFEYIKKEITAIIGAFHQRFPMRIGLNKAEIFSELNQYPTSVIEFGIESLSKENVITVSEHVVFLSHVTPSLPPKWKKKLVHAEKEIIKQGIEVEKWSELLHRYQIPADIQKDFYYFLIQTGKAFILEDNRLVSKVATDEARKKLEEHTELEDFNLQTAREILQLSRKNLVPLLELFDRLGYTKRIDNRRMWVKKGQKQGL